MPINVNDVDNTNNLDAAKVAALRAAELGIFKFSWLINCFII